MQIPNESQLLAAFRESEVDEVQLPPNVTFPLTVEDYMAWPEPSGHRVYLIFQESQTGHPMGVVFQRTRGSASVGASMCQWCHAVRAGSEVGLLTTSAGADRRVGVYLCADLDCKEHAERSPGVNDFVESLGVKEKIQRIVGRMNFFAKRNLF